MKLTSGASLLSQWEQRRKGSNLSRSRSRRRRARVGVEIRERRRRRRRQRRRRELPGRRTNYLMANLSLISSLPDRSRLHRPAVYLTSHVFSNLSMRPPRSLIRSLCTHAPRLSKAKHGATSGTTPRAKFAATPAVGDGEWDWWKRDTTGCGIGGKTVEGWRVLNARTW